MSRNTQVLQDGGRIRLQQGEHLLQTSDNADVELRIPPTVSGPKKTETGKGRIWLTDRRLVFSAQPATDPVASSASTSSGATVLTSLQVPFSCIQASSFQLPIFGANHLLIAFLPDARADAPPAIDDGAAPGGGQAISSLPHPGRGGKLELKVVFADGAGHGIWKRIEGERARAAERQREEEQLPAYTAQ